jgi:hypothetical protein
MAENTDPETKTEIIPTPDQIETAGVNLTERDIVFECAHCNGELIVDQEGAGLDLPCPLCGNPVKVPEYHGASLQFLQAATAKLATAVRAARTASPRQFQFEGRSLEELRQRRAELQRGIRESQAQATEIKGHIHHATIQLHRYQLRLEVIQERQAELKAELDAMGEGNG